jgi:hypothetical protein
MSKMEISKTKQELWSGTLKATLIKYGQLWLLDEKLESNIEN